MDYDKNCYFRIKKKNQDIVVKNNKLSLEVLYFKIFEVDENKDIIYKTTLSEEGFFSKYKNGIFFIRIYYKNLGESENIKYYIKLKEGTLILQRSRYPLDLSGVTKKFPDNIFRNDGFEMDNKECLKILSFYVINNPSIKNQKSITAKFYNIKENWGEDCWKTRGSLKQKLIDTFDDYKNSVRRFNTVNDSGKSINALRLNDTEFFDKRVRIAFEDVCNNTFLSIFRNIRNGFAHGRFYCYKCEGSEMIFIEDVDKDNVTARITIPISLLVNWIDIIKSKEY